ncbi:ankyrin repeat domain-containing protein [Nannocystaceae bacterium ST9]
MADEGDPLRRSLTLERRFLRPDRAALDEAILAAPTGPRVWQRAIAAGRLPISWTDDPLRRFRASEAQLRRTPELAAELAPGLATGLGGSGRFLTAVPSDRQAARLLASDPQGMLEAERLAREWIAALLPFGVDARARRIAWRIAGNPIERPEAGEPPLGRLRAPIDRLRQLMLRLSGPALEPPHPHRRFRPTHELLTWSQRRTRALDLAIPSEFGELAGRRLGELDDPFEPGLRLIETGYWLWAVSDATIELAAPFPAPSGARPDKRGRPGVARVSRPSVVWADRLGELRLACMRGDPAWVARLLARVAETREPGGAPLIHFGVHGGPDVLDVLAAHDAAIDIEASDDEGRTPLMLAAGLPRRGPLGARARELEVPVGLAHGRAACRWLLARGAKLEARDLRGWTALHWAACEGRPDAVAILIRQGADLEARDPLGRTPLLLALHDEGRELSLVTSLEVVELLLAAGADADARDDEGWTALHRLAMSPRLERRSLASRLRAAGAQPSRDRLGRSPADLAGSNLSRDPAFDPRTPVAAGPGPWPARARASELERSLTEDPDRLPIDTLAVWADWLQSQGDARGELLAATLSCAAIGRKRRAARSRELERIGLRVAALRDRGLRLADPAGGLAGPWIEVRRAHGLIVRARLSGHPDPTRAAVRALIEHEPLLTDLRLATRVRDQWPELLAAIATIDPTNQIRRLMLADLPAEVPDLDLLPPAFPRVRELRLIGRGKLDSLALTWPALEILRIRHGDTSEWGRGGSTFEIAPGRLHTLDLGLPIGGLARDDELEGFRSLLDRLGPELRTLRLSPVAAEFLAALLAALPLPGLRSLVLERMRGRAIELLVDRIAELARFERLELSVTARVFQQRNHELTLLRESLPKLELSVR